MSTVDPLEISRGARAEGRWRRLPPAARIGIVIVCAVLGVNLLARFVQESTGGSEAPGGRRSSAYATGNDGLAAYAELLGHEGHAVERTRGPIATARSIRRRRSSCSTPTRSAATTPTCC